METKDSIEKQSPKKPSGKGGARPGAGRKPGVRNKKTRAVLENVEATGDTPLQFLLKQMRNERNPRDVRMEAAKAAAPYVHAKLANIEMTANVTTHEATLEDLK